MIEAFGPALISEDILADNEDEHDEEEHDEKEHDREPPTKKAQKNRK